MTGLSRLIIVDSPDEKKQPAAEIKVKDGKIVRKYYMPSHAHLMVQDGEMVSAGDVPAKIPRETTRPRTSRAVCRAWGSCSCGQGEPLMDGPSNPHDILNVLGEKALQAYLVNEIQEVYRLCGPRQTWSCIRPALHPG